MKKIDEKRIEELINSIKQEKQNQKRERDFEELAEILKPWIKRMVYRVIPRFRNPNYHNLCDEAKFALYESALRFDELRHERAVNYLGNYVWDHLKRIARDDRNNGFPGFKLATPINTDEDIPEFDFLNVAPDGYIRNLEASPEQCAMLNEAFDRLNAIGSTPSNNKKVPSLIRVAIDIQEHPTDISVTSIAKRTGIPKSTVSDTFKKIIKILTDESRTNLN